MLFSICVSIHFSLNTTYSIRRNNNKMQQKKITLGFLYLFICLFVNDNR